MSFDTRTKRLADVIISIFETARYDTTAVSKLPGENWLSYGSHQFTGHSGSLWKVIATFCKSVPADNPFRKVFDKFPQLASTDAKQTEFCANNKEIKNALRESGKTPEMKEAQRLIFYTNYLYPAIEACEGSGYTKPLSLVVVADSLIQGSFAKIRDRVPARLPETAWISQYVAERHNWLSNHTKKVIRNSSYRTQELKNLIEADLWDLPTPLVIRSVTVTEGMLV